MTPTHAIVDNGLRHGICYGVHIEPSFHFRTSALQLAHPLDTSDDARRERAAEHTQELGRKFAEKLRETRLLINLTQAELGRRVGIDQARISRIENGDEIPSLATCVQLAEAVGRRLILAMVTEKQAEILDALLADFENLLGELGRSTVREPPRRRRGRPPKTR